MKMKILVLTFFLLQLSLLSFSEEEEQQSLIGISHPGVYVELPQWAKGISPTETDIPKLCTNSIDRLTKRTATSLLSIIDALKERQGKWLSYDSFKYGDMLIPQPDMFDKPVREFYTNLSLRTEAVLNNGVYDAFKNTKMLIDCDGIFSRVGSYFGTDLISQNEKGKFSTKNLYGYEMEPTNRENAAKIFLSAISNGIYATFFDIAYYGNKEKKSAQTPWFGNAASFTSAYVPLDTDRSNGGAIGDISNVVNTVAGRVFEQPDETKYKRICGTLPAIASSMDASINICYQPSGFGAFFGSTSNVTSELLGDYKLKKRYEEVKVTDIKYGIPFNRDSTNLTYVKIAVNKEVDESEKDGKYHISRDVQTFGGDSTTRLIASVKLDDCTGAAKVIVTSGYSSTSFPVQYFDDGLYPCDILYTVYADGTCDWEHRIYTDEQGGRFESQTTYGTPYIPQMESFQGGADLWVRSDGAKSEIFHLTDEIATTNDDVSAVWKNIPFHFPASKYKDCFNQVYLQTGIVWDYSWENEDICEARLQTTSFRDSDTAANGIIKDLGKQILDTISDKVKLSVEQLEDENGLQQYTDSKLEEAFKDMKSKVTSEYHAMSINHEILAKKIQIKDGHIEAIFDNDGQPLQQDKSGKWITCAYITVIQENASITNVDAAIKADINFSRVIKAKPDNLPLEPKSN